MSNPVKITSLALENVKRVKALYLTPSAAGLTVLGGKNGQGKTSVLDGLAWGCGGNKMAPSNPKRDDSINPPSIDITLSNGIRIKRAGKSSSLTVLDPSGNKAGQALLDSFIGQFALDLPKFMGGNAKDKANALLQILGIGDQLRAMEAEEKRLYDDRTALGRLADAKAKHAQELPEYPDTPDIPISASELIRQQQDILTRNGENQRKREQVGLLEAKIKVVASEIFHLEERIQALQEQAAKKHQEAHQIQDDLNIAKQSAEQLQDESTAELEASLANIEAINAQVAANAAKANAAEEAAELKAQYDELTTKIDAVRANRMALLDGADLPLPGLTVEDGELLYNGQPWDCMSGSEQLRVSVAIVRAMNPQCGFVLVDKLEQMDVDTMREFGEWLESQGLQAICTRVTTNPDECSIIIEDGLPLGETYIDQVTKKAETPTTTPAPAEEEEFF